MSFNSRRWPWPSTLLVVLVGALCAHVGEPMGALIAASGLPTTVAPSVYAITPEVFSPGGGETVEIQGERFGSDANTITVTIDNVLCVKVAVQSNGLSLTCVVPAGIGSSKAIVVRVGGLASIPAPLLTYAPPTIFSLQELWTLPGMSIIVYGKHFSETK